MARGEKKRSPKFAKHMMELNWRNAAIPLLMKEEANPENRLIEQKQARNKL